jgi:hypothetical protein
MKIAVLRLHIRFPESNSLKSKRRLLKPLLVRLQRDFNVSAAEVGLHDKWKESQLACALVSNSEGHATRSLQKVESWLEGNWPNIQLVDESIEII